MFKVKNNLILSLLIFVIVSSHIFAGKKKNNIIDEEFQSLKDNRLLMNYDFQNFSKQSLVSSLNNPKSENSKSPWLAFGLSLFLPGMGQIYNGDYTKAIVQMGMVLGGVGLVELTACTECGDAGQLQTAAFITGLGLAGIGYIWSIFDAPISASNKNSRLNLADKSKDRNWELNTFARTQTLRIPTDNLISIKIAL